jgi:hypothetical protein
MAEPGRGAPGTGGTPAEPVPAPAPAADGQLQLPNSQVLAQCEGNDDATDLQVLSRNIPEVDGSNGETNWDGLDLVSATRVALALTVASRAPAKVAHLKKLLKRLAIVVNEYALLKRPEAIAYLRTNPLDLRCTADTNGQKVLIGRVIHFLHSGIARTGRFARTVSDRSVFLEVFSTEHSWIWSSSVVSPAFALLRARRSRYSNSGQAWIAFTTGQTQLPITLLLRATPYLSRSSTAAPARKRSATDSLISTLSGGAACPERAPPRPPVRVRCGSRRVARSRKAARESLNFRRNRSSER